MAVIDREERKKKLMADWDRATATLEEEEVGNRTLFLGEKKGRNSNGGLGSNQFPEFFLNSRMH